MKTLTTASAALALSAAVLAGCKDDHGHPHDKPAPASTQPGATAKGSDEHTNQTVLGETTVGGMKCKAIQDEPAKPGGEGAFDLIITGYPAGGKPKAVRSWVGTESGEGSVKAKAEEEKPDNWHTHVEVPNP